MAGLLKSMPPRANRQTDAAALSRSAKNKTMTPSVKGGKGLYDRISTVQAVISTKLGKYIANYFCIRDEESVIRYFDKIIENGIGTIDTECSSLNPMTCILAGICIYTPGEKPAYIPMHHVSYVTGIESSNQVSDELILSCLDKCKQAGVKWIMHHAKFDTRVIKNKLGITIPCHWDTMLGAKCLNENESAALKELTLKYCESQDTEALTYGKLFDGIPFTLIPIQTAYLYAAGDAIKTYQLYEFQRHYLNRQKLPGVYNIFRNIEMPLIPIVADMEDTGIALDEEFCIQLSTKYTEILKQREENFYAVLGMYQKEIDKYKSMNPNHKLSDPISVGSPTQISIVLYDIIGLISPDKDKPRGTGEEILVNIDIPLCKVILEYRETAKLLSTYVDKMPKELNPKTNRVHCSFNQYGAATGRFSSSDPNMQNIPSGNKEIRKMFSATPGYVMISTDYSQQEPRMLTHCCGDPHMREAYAQDKDIYAWIGSIVYKMPYDECLEFRPDGTKNPAGKKRRTEMKSVLLGLMYGRGAKAIGEQLGISAKEAQKIVQEFFTTFPLVKKWSEQVVANAKKNGYVETPFGRKRRLPDIQLEPYEFILIEGRSPNFDPLSFDDIAPQTQEVDAKIRNEYVKRLESKWSMKEKAIIRAEAKQRGIIIKDNGGFIADAERQCVNSIIQGGSADITKLAMIAVGNDIQLREWGYRMVLTVHDELIGECPEQYAKQCANRVCQIMISAVSDKISVPMKVDAEITRQWYGEEVA